MNQAISKFNGNYLQGYINSKKKNEQLTTISTGTVELDIYRHVIVNHKHQNAEESSNFASISSLLNAAKGAAGRDNDSDRLTRARGDKSSRH